MHTLSDYEVIRSLPDSENSFEVEDKVDGGIKALHIIEYKDLGDFHTQSLLSRLISLERTKSHPNHVEYVQHFIKKEVSSICVLMELVHGTPLYNFIERCREENLQFEENYIWRVLAQLYGVIEILSSGSLTLKNVFIDKKGDVKWNSVISEDSPVCLRHQLGCLATEMCTAGESTYIPSFYSKDLREVISSLILGDKVTFKSTSSKDYPKLYPRIPGKPILSDEIFDFIKSNPNIYESVIYSDANRQSHTPCLKLPEDELKFRIHAIKAQEALLRQKELNLIIKEKNLLEREQKITELEKKFKAERVLNEKDRTVKDEPVLPKRPPKPKTTENTYFPSEPMRPPTVARLKIPPLPPRVKTFQQQKKVTYKSPKKFIKYDIEVKPNSPTTSEESDAIVKRRSILSILGLNPQRLSKSPEFPENQEDVKIKVSGIAKWTNENKKAAFEMLAAMNAKGSVVGSKGSSQRIYDRSRSRRTFYGMKTSF